MGWRWVANSDIYFGNTDMKITFTLHAESRNMTLTQCKIYNKAENGQTILAFPSIIAGPELQSPAEKIDMGSAGIYPVP